MAFPDAPNVETEEIELGEMFYVNGTDLWVSPPNVSEAVAFTDSLYGRTIQVNITCTRTDGSDLSLQDQDDSCILFEVNFTTYR